MSHLVIVYFKLLSTSASYVFLLHLGHLAMLFLQMNRMAETLMSK